MDGCVDPEAQQVTYCLLYTERQDIDMYAQAEFVKEAGLANLVREQSSGCKWGIFLHILCITSTHGPYIAI